jgi:hypothetical protein
LDGLSQKESGKNQTMPSSAPIGQGLDRQERDHLSPDVMGLSQLESNFRVFDENRILKEEIKRLEEEKKLGMAKLAIRIIACEELWKENNKLKVEIKKMEVEKESETGKLLLRIKECEELEKENKILKDQIKKLEDERDSEKIQLADEVDNLAVHNLTQGIAYNVEIEEAKEKVGALVSENAQLYDEFCEVAAQNATQQATNENFLEALLQDATVQQSARLTEEIKSMYGRIKKRDRKVFMKADYCYPAIQRELQKNLDKESMECQKTEAAQGKGIIEAVTTVDDLPVPKKRVLKFPNRSSVLKVLNENDRNKLRAAIENEEAR